MKKTIGVCFILVSLLILAGCTAGANPLENKANSAGFWKGLWHGLISPITFIISIFPTKIRIYEVYNTGFWYNFGFVLGAGLFFSGGILGRCSKKKKKC